MGKLGKMKKVTIIIPAFNAEEHIAECLNSIITQDYSNLEVIVVNDGSTDGTLKTVLSYVHKDSRIKVISIPNGGAGSAKNHGIDIATGDFLTFVDSDDWLESNYISALVKQKEHYHSNIAATSYKVFQQDDGGYYVLTDPKPGDHHYDGVEKPAKWLEKFLPCIWPFDGYTHAKLYDRALFRNVRYPNSWTISEDEFVLWKLVMLSDAVSFENKVTYYYRTHQPQSLTTGNGQLYYSQVALLNEKIAVLKAAGQQVLYLRGHYVSQLQHLKKVAERQGNFHTVTQAKFRLRLISIHSKK